MHYSQVDANTAVAIYAEGKEYAMAVGLTKMSTTEMREVRCS
jgi:predicted ribosome-associated RNA-binding protein Tma20